MHSAHYDVSLLSDAVITADAATTGGHSGLDYLPGSLFLGAAAAEAKLRGESFDPDLFLSGKVRFLDALPLAGNQPTVPIPFCFHKIKGKPWQGQPPLNMLTAAPKKDEQPKQWRQGYMTESGLVKEITLESRMKTAINRDLRRSEDAQLFGYESIPAGTRFRMTVEADSAGDLDRIKKLFENGILRLGRSRSAEYGAVRLAETDAPSHSLATAKKQENSVVLFLLSDLALAENGMPVLIPKAAHFGLENAELDPARTFTRVRRYSPWNAFHNCRLSERQVLCKGSVLTFTTQSPLDPNGLQKQLAGGVGLYREEGLGRIAVNPSCILEPPKMKAFAAETPATPQSFDTPLCRYLNNKAETKDASYTAFVLGVQWAKEWSKLGKKVADETGKAPGKNQWGTIRELAVRSGGKMEKLKKYLDDFCGKGLRSRIWTVEVWGEGKKTISLYGAIVREIQEATKTHNEKTASLALFHASVEMARILSRTQGKEAAGK